MVTKTNKGFTLIELLVAVAILGVLVTLALPRYKSSVARSRMAEAKVNLGTIHKLQESYYLKEAALKDTAAYHSGMIYGGKAKCDDTEAAEGLNTLGFRLIECSKARYIYKSATGNDEAEGGLKTDGTLPIYPDCGTNDEDKWTMSKGGQLTHATDVVSVCKG